MRPTYTHVCSMISPIAHSCLVVLVLLVVMCALSSPASALTPEQIQQITDAADFIVSCQVTGGDADGLIAMGDNPNTLWGCPYFANFAAIGLVRAYQATSDTTYLTAVEDYVSWYALHLNTDGSIYDWGGTWANPINEGTYDSTDSYAATFLMLLWEKYQADGNVTWLSSYRYVAENVYNAMMMTVASDGLTWCKPGLSGRTKYLEDNLEVREGLRASYQIFTTLGITDYAGYASSALTNNRNGLRGMYSSSLQYFAISKNFLGIRTFAFSNWYPDGQANAFACAYLGLPGNTDWNVLAGWIDWVWPSSYDYWRFVTLWKWGYTTDAAVCQANLPQTYSSDRGLYIRSIMPEYDAFYYTTEELALPNL